MRKRQRSDTGVGPAAGRREPDGEVLVFAGVGRSLLSDRAKISTLEQADQVLNAFLGPRPIPAR